MVLNKVPGAIPEEVYHKAHRNMGVSIDNLCYFCTPLISIERMIMVADTIQTGRTSPINSGQSEKQRLLEFLMANANSRGRVPLTVVQISKGVHISAHEITHFIKDSLFKENLVNFRSSKASEKSPNGGIKSIRLTAKAMGREFRNQKLDDSGWPVGRPTREEQLIRQTAPTTNAKDLVEVLSSGKSSKLSPKKFPLIEALSVRKETLSQAARLAESSGAEDLAIQLMERAELSAFEMEATDLLAAYRACKE